MSRLLSTSLLSVSLLRVNLLNKTFDYQEIFQDVYNIEIFSVDMMIQYGEDQDVRARDDPEISEEQEDFMEKQMRELGIQWKYLFTVECHYETSAFLRSSR